jgi:hypothetical protein
MKHLLISGFFLFLHLLCSSQTYITPIIGVDFTEMKTIQSDPNFYKFDITDKGFSLKSFLFGIKVEQVLSTKLNLSLQSNYTTKKTNAFIFSAIAYDGFKYNYLRSNLSLNYIPIKFLLLGIGYDFNLIKKVKYTLRGDVFTEFISSLNDHGPSFSIGSRWKNLEIIGYFHKGVNPNSDKSGLSLNPINSIGVYAGYSFKLFKIKSKKKDPNCPKF